MHITYLTPLMCLVNHQKRGIFRPKVWLKSDAVSVREESAPRVSIIQHENELWSEDSAARNSDCWKEAHTEHVTSKCLRGVGKYKMLA
jgi:hypothetical protein